MARPHSPADLSTPEGRLAARFRSRRMAIFDTQQRFAEALNDAGVDVSFRAVSNWERGYTLPTLFDFPIIVRELGSDLDDFLEPVFPEMVSLRQLALRNPNTGSKIPTVRLTAPNLRKRVRLETRELKLAHRLRCLRHAAGFQTLDEFSQFLDKQGYEISLDGISHWECAYTAPPIVRLPVVAYSLRVTIDDLFFDIA